MKINCWRYQYLIVLCFIIYGCEGTFPRLNPYITLYSYICDENDFGSALKKTFAVYPSTQKVVGGKGYPGPYQLKDCSVYDYDNWHCKGVHFGEISVYKGREIFDPLQAIRSYKEAGSITVPIGWYDFWSLWWREKNINAYCKGRLELTKKTAEIEDLSKIKEEIKRLEEKKKRK